MTVRSEQKPAHSSDGPLSLKTRFERFMAEGDFVEGIDAITPGNQPPGRQRADYLAYDRSVIIEQKSFDRDVELKVRAVLSDLIQQHGPIEREHVTIRDIIEVIGTLPAGNPFKPRLREILTQKFDDVLAKADKQTRDTRLTFSIPKAIGVVVVLNEHAPLIEPDYFWDKTWDVLRRETAPGILRYPENQVVILISEAHRIPSEDGSDRIPVETAFSDAGAESPNAKAFAEDFHKRWAAFNNAGMMESPDPVREVTTRDPATVFKTG
jgi:hypothetical protein